MKVSEAIQFYLQYKKANAKGNSLKNYRYILRKFENSFRERQIDTITTEEIISFLTAVTQNNKQNTKRSRYSTLKAFFNFISYTVQPDLTNPCDSPATKKLFHNPKSHQWTIFDKDIIDEAIFRTTDIRNRLILELMARGGMRISEVLGIQPADVENRKLLLRAPKSGRELEVVFIPQKLSTRLSYYIKDKDMKADQRIFPLSYSGARKMVVKVGQMVGIKLRPHDLRRHAATYASRAGTPLEIVSKVILRHSDLSTTQQYLGKVSDYEALRWIENLHG
jgi:integrase/recombinase XerD